MAVQRRTQIWITVAIVVAAVVAILITGTGWLEVLGTAVVLLLVLVAIRVATGWGRTGQAGIEAQFTSPTTPSKRTYVFVSLAILAVVFALLIFFTEIWSTVLALVLAIVATAVLVVGRRNAQA